MGYQAIIRRCGHAVGAAIAFGAGISSAAAVAPPQAEVQPVTDEYFGVRVTDNYRWMEAEPEPQFRDMLVKQNAFARAVIAGLPGRDALQREISTADTGRAVVLTVWPTADKEFYLKKAPGEQTSKLYVRDIARARETPVVDPDTLKNDERPTAIDQFSPSQDGTLVAYAVSTGGSEQSVLHVKDVSTGRDLPDVIDRAELAAVSWLPDGKGFFYTRTAKTTRGAAANEAFSHLKVFLHRLGGEPERDTLILDVDSLPFPFTGSQAVPAIVVTPGSHYVLAEITNGTSRDHAIYTAPLSAVTDGRAAWKAVALQSDGVASAAVRGDRIFLLTHTQAPRFRIVEEDLRRPGFASAKTVIGERPGVLTGLAASSEALYIAERTGGGMTLSRLAYGDAVAKPIDLPYSGTIYPPGEDAGALSANPKAKGAVFELEAWTRPPAWFRYDPGTGRVADTGIIPPVAIDLSSYETVETEVRALDGVMVPLSIVFKKGIALDRSHPTLLEAYGSFGVSFDPVFRPSVLTWLDHGGVFAEAHVRGGGEKGEPWHRYGMLDAKENTITDYIACAEALIKLGYTDPGHLAGMGVSGGGLTIGGAITRRPDLFRAAVISVGAVNALRFGQLQIGPMLAPEYGSVNDPKQFATLLKIDAYQHVADGVPYPAVLLTAGFNDPRILPWMPAKMAARLQAATSSGRPVLLEVAFEGGHGITDSATVRDAERADEYAFLFWQLSGTDEHRP